MTRANTTKVVMDDDETVDAAGRIDAIKRQLTSAQTTVIRELDRGADRSEDVRRKRGGASGEEEDRALTLDLKR